MKENKFNNFLMISCLIFTLTAVAYDMFGVPQKVCEYQGGEYKTDTFMSFGTDNGAFSVTLSNQYCDK